jgi:alcohol dehydrogenase
MIDPFLFAATPHIDFGTGRRNRLPDIVRPFGCKILLVTGEKSFDHSSLCQDLLTTLQKEFEVRHFRVAGEPSPALVDDAVDKHKAFSPVCVVAIGGGSAIDTAKAIAGLLPTGDSVMEYLEGVGKGKMYQGPSTPFIAIPTTAGTGGETSKNAVLSMIGPEGFKKSFRDEALVARHIILDPELTLSCPAHVSAACGMDALTQLMESYVSCKASPMTDALALGALKRIGNSLLVAVERGDDIYARADMLYASSISGLTLSNAGLGSVHGLASPLGAFFPIPHGEACGTMLVEATRTNIRAMQERDPDNVALEKYAQVGRLLCKRADTNSEKARESLLNLLEDWTKRLTMPRLSDYQVTESDIPRIIAHISGGSMATNPIVLKYSELTALLRSRM